jgi:hypothetical protein
MLKITGVLGLAIATAAALLPAAAQAQPAEPVTKVTNSDRSGDIKKQVGLVDLYLTAAINDAKFLTVIADAAPGSMDRAILSEARKDLDQAIDRALDHVAGLRAWKSDLTPAATLDELERQLKSTRAAGKKLPVNQLSDLPGAIDGVAAHLMGADNAFRAVARWASYTRLSRTSLSTVPVRGDELPPARGATRDLDVK